MEARRSFGGRPNTWPRPAARRRRARDSSGCDSPVNPEFGDAASSLKRASSFIPASCRRLNLGAGSSASCLRPDGLSACFPADNFNQQTQTYLFTMTPAQLRRAREALDQFAIETPSWGFADTGTRFGKFFQDASAID